MADDQWVPDVPDGAFVIGGGDYRYGQDMTEDIARSLFQIPDFNPSNALLVLPQLLLRLPLEALQKLRDFIPNVLDGAFDTVGGAVNAIMGAIRETPRVLEQILDYLPQELRDTLEHAAGLTQAVIDAIVQAFTGAQTIGHGPEDLIFALANIIPSAISGVLGTTTMEEFARRVIDEIVSGAVGQSGTGAQFSDLRTVIEQIASAAARGDFAWILANFLNNKPVTAGLHASERGNFGLDSINTTVTVSPGTSLIAFDRIEQAMPVGLLTWIGWGTSGITEFYINVYRVIEDRDEPELGELIHQSENVAGILAGTTSPGANISYEFPAPLAAEIGDQLAYEFITVGGSHTFKGRDFDLPDSDTAPIGNVGATRTLTTPALPPNPLLKADVTWTDTVPRVGLAVDTGSGSNHHDPQQELLAGPIELPVPAWADAIDAIVTGEGGDASPGIAGFPGNPGQPAGVNTITWRRPEHFSGTTTILTWDGHTLSIPGYEVSATNGADGVGNRPITAPKPVGQGIDDVEYNGLTLIGGKDQGAYGGAGTAPGGGGAGGHWFGIYTQGGQGGPARAAVQFRKGLLPGETPGDGEGDTTPPDTTALTVDVIPGLTSITFKPSGAVDV
ncbi:minor tail protein [Mycobacterium phage Peterson]|nr:minor tail protein [Mycobacterium phage Peterson]